MCAAGLSLSIDPAPRAWPGLLKRGIERRDTHAQPFRSQLGLGTGRPIVMTGHQLVAWHPGILAKYLAAHSFAHHQGAQVAWIGVDQDSELADDIRYPVSDPQGGLRVETVRLRPPATTDIAAASLSAVRPEPPRTPAGLLPSVQSGIESIVTAWTRHADEPTAARQASRALSNLLAPYGPPSLALLATSLSSTSLFAHVIDRMRSDARRCAELYNAAVAANPAAHVGALRLDATAIELPLWALAPNQPRRRVLASDLENLKGATLAPRALLMTGLLRWAACDLFIHGKGGAIYDTITERWLGEWLGITLAPTVMISADLHLPLQPPGVTLRAAADAHWRAHRADHDPAIIGDAATATAKRTLVEKIAQRRAAGERPLDDYRKMHAVLADYRTRHAGTLTELKLSAKRLSAAVATREIATDRTWAFPLYPAEALADLRSAIESSFR